MLMSATMYVVAPRKIEWKTGAMRAGFKKLATWPAGVGAPQPFGYAQLHRDGWGFAVICCQPNYGDGEAKHCKDKELIAILKTLTVDCAVVMTLDDLKKFEKLAIKAGLKLIKLQCHKDTIEM